MIPRTPLGSTEPDMGSIEAVARPYIASFAHVVSDTCASEGYEALTIVLDRVEPDEPAGGSENGSAPLTVPRGRRRKGAQLGPTGAVLLGLIAAAVTAAALWPSGGPGAQPDAAAPAMTRSGAPTPSLTAAPRAARPAAAPARNTTRPTPSAQAGSATSEATAAPSVLQPGDRGAAVAQLQRSLYGQGFTYVQVTGVYDAVTTEAVRQLQTYDDVHGDTPGDFGPATRAALAHDGS